ncbi:hypothetical protein AJ80_00114 [Polytolypa hystricis UAMH7299]|uniref:DNA repair and recombination protein RAD54B n=1 Tax=Polytolypa hystricis (strain UAMH7299) TaxID=1447883 RepID=A0A2B7YVW1_POLH7|nr:hypothetical protein AJ80_00114 [Polytolypa hystricis UAMH7299]
MPFKPFRPPLIKKPTTSTNPPSTIPEPPTDRPPKRRRISEEAVVDFTLEDGEPKKTVTGSRLSIIAKNATGRRPLLTVKNQAIGAGELGKGDGPGMESHYNVLWRKITAKKHKTWDGDGVLIVRGGYAHLQDVSGRDMGRIMFNSPLLPGSALSIGGKDVEVDSLLSKEEYLSGRVFLSVGKNAPVAPISVDMDIGKKGFKEPLQISPIPAVKKVIKLPPRTQFKKPALGDEEDKLLNVPAPKSQAMNSAFKNPLKESTVFVQKPNNEPTPRHDPTAPGAVVMKRPASVPKGKRVVDVVLDPLLGKHLREHQREGVKFLYECVMGLRPFNGEGAVLADEMGLGKTLQTIALLWTLLKQNPIYEASPVVKKALIVCPVTLINNWRREFRKWLGNERIGVFVADGKNTRLTDFTMGKSYSVMIIGYERLRTVQEELSKGSGIDIVIADEGHRLKTVQNKSAQAIQSLNTARRIILSGTPIQNDLTEFFAMVDFVNPGLLGTFKMFMKEFEGPIVKSRQPGASKKDIEKGQWRSEELANLTSMFILRRTAEILSKYLPPKTEYVLFCEPTSTQANIYRSVLGSPIFQSALGSSESALQLITILKKLCNSPSLINPRGSDQAPNQTTTALLSSLPPGISKHLSPASSGKIRVLDQLLHNIRSTTNEKVVIVSNYTSTLDLLANLLSSLSLPFLRLDGSTPAAKRQPLVDDFNRSFPTSCFAFLLSAKAGGMGLNLIGASRLILFDVDWNPATDMQAMARIHRDGQKRHCRIYRFVLKGGIEEKIWQRQVTKIGLADSVMDQKKGSAQFSREELRDLFRLDEGPDCQTHQLVGCECGGRGGVESSNPTDVVDLVGSEKSSCTELEIIDSDEDDDEEYPDVAALIKASELKAAQLDKAEQNADVKPKQSKKKVKQMSSLLQYSHIDPALFASAADLASLDEKGFDARDLETVIDDDVLVTTLKEEGNRVRYVFKKS